MTGKLAPLPVLAHFLFVPIFQGMRNIGRNDGTPVQAGVPCFAYQLGEPESVRVESTWAESAGT